MDDSDSDLSSALSSPPPEEELIPPPKPVLKLINGKLTAAPTKATPSIPLSPSPEPQREPSPPHEYVLADNPDIAFIVAFRTKFGDAFPKNVPNLGPQDIERGVVESLPSEPVENLLCALLGLVLNRKKYVERGHYGRALEDAVTSQKTQWPRAWKDASPISGGKTFQTMDPTERITLLKTLILWALNSSEVIGNILKEAYKQSRHEDDLNQPLAVHPRGADGQKRRYWMIEGDVDASFRIYRESNPKRKENTWWSVAGSIEELQSLSITLRDDKSQAARRLADHFVSEIPRLEQVEEKRKRKEYRQARKAAFTRPEPGYSLYEGRTRGKRMKYTYSDDEDDVTDGLRRSSRQANRETPNDEETVTSSGRHVRSRFGRSYGDAVEPGRDSSDFASDTEGAGRAERAARRANGRRRSYEMSEGSDDGAPDLSGDDWDADADDVREEDEDEVMSDAGSDDSLMDSSPRSLVVTLKYKTANRIDGVEQTAKEESPDPLSTVDVTPSKTVPTAPAAASAHPQAVPEPAPDANHDHSQVKTQHAGTFESRWAYKPHTGQSNGVGLATPSATSSRPSPPRVEPSHLNSSPPFGEKSSVKPTPVTALPLTPNTDASPDVSQRTEQIKTQVPPVNSSPYEPSTIRGGINEYEHSRPVILSPKRPSANPESSLGVQPGVSIPPPAIQQTSSERFG